MGWVVFKRMIVVNIEVPYPVGKMLHRFSNSTAHHPVPGALMLR